MLLSEINFLNSVLHTMFAFFSIRVISFKTQSHTLIVYFEICLAIYFIDDLNHDGHSQQSKKQIATQVLHKTTISGTINQNCKQMSLLLNGKQLWLDRMAAEAGALDYK